VRPLSPKHGGPEAFWPSLFYAMAHHPATNQVGDRRVGLRFAPLGPVCMGPHVSPVASSVDSRRVKPLAPYWTAIRTLRPRWREAISPHGPISEPGGGVGTSLAHGPFRRCNRHTGHMWRPTTRSLPAHMWAGLQRWQGLFLLGVAAVTQRLFTRCYRHGGRASVRPVAPFHMWNRPPSCPAQARCERG